jgi:hypothetical protein
MSASCCFGGDNDASHANLQTLAAKNENFQGLPAFTSPARLLAIDAWINDDQPNVNLFMILACAIDARRAGDVKVSDALNLCRHLGVYTYPACL